MSPEQAQARRDVLDHRTDIYALGATLYELLTLRPAVPGEERGEILRRLTCEEVVWPSRLNPAIPPDLEAIVLRAMAKAPGERYATAQELAEDLRRFVDGQPVRARRPTRLQRAGKWARRHCRTLLATAVIGFLTLALAATLLALSNVRFRAALALSDLRAQQERVQAGAEREKVLDLALTGWNEARLSRQARHPGQRYRSLEALAESVRQLRSLDQLDAHRADLRDDAIASLTLWDVRPVRNLPATLPLPWPAVDPLGRHYATADGPNAVSWRRRADDQVVHRWRCEGGACVALDVSPDGRYVWALCQDDQRREAFRVWDGETGRQVLHHPVGSGEHAFRPDGKALALLQPDGSLALCDLGTGAELPPLPDGLVAHKLRFHPGGRYLAAISRAHEDVEVWDLAAGKVFLRVAGGRFGRAASLAWSPDGSLLAVGSCDTNIYVYSFPGGKVQAVLRGHEHMVTGVEFHPSGRLLASSSHDDTTRLWCFAPGGELVLPGENARRFSTDGRRLITGSWRGVTEWEVADPGGCLHYLPFGEGPSWQGRGVAFAPDGRLLASASEDGALLWDAAAARLVGRLPSGDGYAVAFHPTEPRLFTAAGRRLMQWPIAPAGDGRALRVGPGTVLRARAGQRRSLRIAVADTGKSLLLNDDDGGVDLVPLPGPGPARWLGPHEDVWDVALSPDGRWAASVGNPDDTVCVWDVPRGTAVWRFPYGHDMWCGATFSPDGRWLVVAVRSHFSFREVGSWEEKGRLPREPRSLCSTVAFTRDGRLLALIQGRNRIHLHDAATLRHLATLEVPGSGSLWGLSLSPDGTRLAATSDYNVMALWDLRRLRRELAALDLDWERPPYPPAEPAAEAAWALTVEVLPAPTGPR
jgi:WD40 repeat protein